jgi:hypothetical protein
VPPVEGFGCLLNIFGPDEQISAANRGIHSAGVIGSDHGLNPDFVQDALAHLGIGR